MSANYVDIKIYVKDAVSIVASYIEFICYVMTETAWKETPISSKACCLGEGVTLRGYTYTRVLAKHDFCLGWLEQI